jgi:hypothetical protein
MNTRILITIVMALLLSLTGVLAIAADGGNKKKDIPPRVKPDLAARREMVRKQQEQRITPEKRQAAVEALKAERLRVYQAKQYVKQHPNPSVN